MAMNTNVVTLSGTTVSALIAQNASRTFLSIANTGSNTIYIGGGSVITSGIGFPLLAGDTLQDTFYIGSYYGVNAASQMTVVRMIEED